MPTEIALRETVVSVSKEVKFLGVVIDEFLSWKGHISELCSRLSSVTYSLRVISNYVNFNTLKVIYYANFESLVRYGLIFFGASTEISRVFIIQKRAMRAMLTLGARESCRGKFRDNKILTVTAMFIQECILFFFKNSKMFENERV